MFQFQTGAIKSFRRSLPMKIALSKFQFQTGAIKRLHHRYHKQHAKPRFNSKLVRLKGVYTHRLRLRGWLQFQFQTGAIKSRRNTFHRTLSMFQFQTGAIKRAWPITSGDEEHCSFNSKLVRLKGKPAVWQSATRFGVFQFQTGAIKRQPRQACTLGKPGFNSKLVRLKAPWLK